MGYIFRIHKKGGANTVTHWNESHKISKHAINSIDDPNGASAKREITSIPSPFARIDLVKNAFDEVVKSGNPDGTTIYHKMVSDSLDVGQIFFNINKYNDWIEILEWNKTNDLKELLNSSVEGHRRLAKTYDIFLKQDAPTYNFNEMSSIFILKCTHPSAKAGNNIIGATSPATLFFSPANDLSYLSKLINFGNDKPFDGDYAPLYKRDIEYQKFWYLLRMSPTFSRLFPEVDEYLTLNYNALQEHERNIINQLDTNTWQNFDPVTTGGAGNPVNVLGIELKQKREHTVIDSDFEIDSDTISGKRPLVLPIDKFAQKLKYVTAIWDPNIKTPHRDSHPLEQRKLPADGSKYPYLTISDFLEDTIIRMPYEINKESFFDGNINNNVKDNSYSYLLPLTETFFQFFTVEQLKGTMPDNKKMIELNEYAGGSVKVTLRIPIQNRKYIEYNRIYFVNNVSDIDEKNTGAVIEAKFGLGVFPLVCFADNVKKHYRIVLFNKCSTDLLLSCHSNANPVSITRKVERRKREQNLCSVESYVLNDKFDRINIKISDNNCVLIPQFYSKTGNTEYTFAIDFGTTNTYIECGQKNSPAQVFAISHQEKQIQRLHTDYKQDRDINAAFEDCLIPDTINYQDSYSFPMRTVFAEHKKINYDTQPYTLADGNIPFRYEKEIIPDYNETRTDLKWSGKENGIIKLYLANLFLLLRNKVLLNNGSLEKTKIIWFYPVSMSEGRCNRFKTLWIELYKEYFGDNTDNLITMSESVAPYYYYKRRGAKSNVVSIDIGGETTDVYVVENHQPKMLSSFRFASNAVFGDGYNWDSDNNGFVNLYKDKFLDILDVNEYEKLKEAFLSIEKKKVSPDIIAFLFSLSSDRQMDNNDSLNFLKHLSENDKLRYVFILFYGAILYFIAKSMKAKGLQKPLTLTFSGNGSKTLRILSENNKTLSKFAKLIFNSVFDEKYDSDNDLDIIVEQEPKKATCKGGILNPVTQEIGEIDKIKCILTGHDLSSEEKICYSEIATIQKDIVTNVVDFMNFMFRLDKDNGDFFSKNFVADAGIIQMIKGICLNKVNLKDYLEHGIERKIVEITGKSSENMSDEERKIFGEHIVEDTLFFYPIIGILNELARKISEL